MIEANLAAVEAHFGSEADGRIDEAVALYTDDIVWEASSRNIVLHGKEAVADNYREMFSGFKDVEFHTLDRFATEERVVDDSVVSMELTKEGFMPFPVGTKVKMRLTHIFEMRDGRISKEIGIEGPPGRFSRSSCHTQEADPLYLHLARSSVVNLGTPNMRRHHGLGGSIHIRDLSPTPRLRTQQWIP